MKIASLFSALLAGALLATSANAAALDVTDPKAPRSLPAEGRVEVNWTDPAQFSEIRQSSNRREARRGDWIAQLALHLRKRAEQRLPTGERLSVTINDVQRAGRFEPWRGAGVSSTRFVRDIYPPRIELEFTLRDAGGSIVEQGPRKLTDLAFLMGSSPVGSTDPLRYEKRLIDDWVNKEFKRPGV